MESRSSRTWADDHHSMAGKLAFIAFGTLGRRINEMFTPIHLGDKRTLIGEHSQQSAPTKAYHLFFEEQ